MKKKIILRIILIILALGVLSAGVVGYLYLSDHDGHGDKNPVTVEIGQGSSVTTIANALADADVIDNALFFRLYIRYFAEDYNFQYGNFELTTNMPYPEIVKALSQISAVEDTATVTFSEGFTIFDMGAELEEKGVCTASEFIEATKDITPYTEMFPFVADIKQDELRYSMLEGYLYPDTYAFHFDTQAVEVIKVLLANFEDKVLSQGVQEAANNAGYTLDEVVILASIIEREVAGIDDQYKNVGSVFMNRLNNPNVFPQLQSDPTYRYVRDEIPEYTGEEVSEAMYDAYDTYTCIGIPVGAVASPSYAAIDAVLNPSDTPYYFFVTDKYKEFYYGVTVAEHDRNVDIAFSVE